MPSKIGLVVYGAEDSPAIEISTDHKKNVCLSSKQKPVPVAYIYEYTQSQTFKVDESTAIYTAKQEITNTHKPQSHFLLLAGMASTSQGEHALLYSCIARGTTVLAEHR